VAGVAHVPSPRQNVVLAAAAPLFRLVTGKLPVTPPAPEDDRFVGPDRLLIGNVPDRLEVGRLPVTPPLPPAARLMAGITLLA